VFKQTSKLRQDFLLLVSVVEVLAKPDTISNKKNGSSQSRIYFTAKLLSNNLFRRVKEESERVIKLLQERIQVVMLGACSVAINLKFAMLFVVVVVAVVVVVSKVTE